MSPGELLDRVAKNVRREREAKGLSQRDLAAAAGTTQRRISAIENGTLNISMETLEQLAKALGVPPHKLTK